MDISSPPSSSSSSSSSQRQKPQLQSLPISRDCHGRSPLSILSPRLLVSSPQAAITPRITWPTKSQSEPEATDANKLVPHLERTLQLGGAQSREGLCGCSKDLQAMVLWCGTNVACEATPTAKALSRVFPQSFPVRYPQPEAVMSALDGMKTDRAMLPVENSLDGTVHRTYDLLLRYNLHIVAEVVQDMANGEMSRFWVLGRQPIMPGQQQQSLYKTTIAMVLSEGLGSLYKVMGAFFFRGIQVTKIESRPWREEPFFMGTHSQLSGDSQKDGSQSNGAYFQYVVFIDVEGSTATQPMQNVLSQLQQQASFLRVLGTYPSFHTCATPRTPAYPRFLGSNPSTPRLCARA